MEARFGSGVAWGEMLVTQQTRAHLDEVRLARRNPAGRVEGSRRGGLVREEQPPPGRSLGLGCQRWSARPSIYSRSVERGISQNLGRGADRRKEER